MEGLYICPLIIVLQMKATNCLRFTTYIYSLDLIVYCKLYIYNSTVEICRNYISTYIKFHNLNFYLFEYVSSCPSVFARFLSHSKSSKPLPKFRAIALYLH